MGDRTEIDRGDEMTERIVAVGVAVSEAAEQLKRAAEQLLAEEEQVKEAQLRARTADAQVKQADLRAQVAEDEARRATAALDGAERRATDASERLADLEARTAQAEVRTRAAEDQAAQTAAKSAELLDELQKLRGQQAETEERARRSEQRVQGAEERAGQLESQVKELRSRLSTIKKLHPGGMPIVADRERNALKDAVAAEVRRPLTSILGIALAMKHSDPKASDGQEMIRQLSSNARKLDRLVSVLLELERLMEGSLKPNRRRTDLQALVRRVVEESPDLANREVKIEATHVVVAVDPAMTEQMLDTLLANAGRRATPGTPIWITVSTDPEGAVIAVDDTGPDVPAGLRTSLPQAGDGRPSGGAPTGMSLLSRLSEVHGGRSWVEEREGGGASFRVFLPDVQEGGAVPDEQAIAAALADDVEDETITI